MTWAEQWVDTLVQSLIQTGIEIAGFIPNLVGMLLILGLGFVLALVAQRVASGLLRRVGFDNAAQRVGLRALFDRAKVTSDASRIIGKLVFWLVMLTFAISATDALGLDNLSQTVDAFVRYLPDVIAAVVMAVVGLMVAAFVRDLVRGSAERIGFEYAAGLSRLAYGVLVVLVGTLVIGQMGIKMDLINRVVEISLMGAGAAMALALGLGTRDMTKHVVAGAYARDIYRPGMRLTVGADAGQLVDVGTVTARITTATGEIVYIPNGHLIDTIVRGVAGTPADVVEGDERTSDG